MGDRADVPAPAATTEPSSPRVADRLARFPLRVMVAAFVAAEVADLGTALSVAGELNPIAAGLLASPIAAAAAKVALILFVVGVVAVTRRVRPLLTRFVLLTGIVAGLFGAITNTHLTPFVLS